MPACIITFFSIHCLSKMVMKMSADSHRITERLLTGSFLGLLLLGAITAAFPPV